MRQLRFANFRNVRYRKVNNSVVQSGRSSKRTIAVLRKIHRHDVKELHVPRHNVQQRTAE